MNDLFRNKSSAFEDLINIIWKQTKLKYGLDSLICLKNSITFEGLMPFAFGDVSYLVLLSQLFCFWPCFSSFLFWPCFPFFLCLSLFSHFSSFGLVLLFFLFWPCFPIFPILATFSLFFLFRCAMLHRVVCRHFLSVNGPRNRLLLHYKHQTAPFLLYQKMGGIGDWGLIFAL